jgi:hypothetical protein
MDLRDGLTNEVIKNYLEGFQGLSNSGSVSLPVDKTIRLPDQPCKFVMLSNFTVLDDMDNTAKPDAGDPLTVIDNQQEIYYGFTSGAGGRLVAQLFVGQSTELLPVNDCNQIIVRSRHGNAGVIYYAWFW